MWRFEEEKPCADHLLETLSLDITLLSLTPCIMPFDLHLDNSNNKLGFQHSGGRLTTVCTDTPLSCHHIFVQKKKKKFSTLMFVHCYVNLFIKVYKWICTFFIKWNTGIKHETIGVHVSSGNTILDEILYKISVYAIRIFTWEWGKVC